MQIRFFYTRRQATTKTHFHCVCTISIESSCSTSSCGPAFQICLAETCGPAASAEGRRARGRTEAESSWHHPRLHCHRDPPCFLQHPRPSERQSYEVGPSIGYELEPSLEREACFRLGYQLGPAHLGQLRALGLALGQGLGQGLGLRLGVALGQGLGLGFGLGFGLRFG